MEPGYLLVAEGQSLRLEFFADREKAEEEARKLAAKAATPTREGVAYVLKVERTVAPARM